MNDATGPFGEPTIGDVLDAVQGLDGRISRIATQVAEMHGLRFQTLNQDRFNQIRKDLAALETLHRHIADPDAHRRPESGSDPGTV